MYMMPKSVMPRPAPKHRPPTMPGVRNPYKHSAIAGTPVHERHSHARQGQATRKRMSKTERHREACVRRIAGPLTCMVMPLQIRLPATPSTQAGIYDTRSTKTLHVRGLGTRVLPSLASDSAGMRRFHVLFCSLTVNDSENVVVLKGPRAWHVVALVQRPAGGELMPQDLVCEPCVHLHEELCV